ncbi:hypothetical protein QJQ45_024297, partial [Haematococcus lacustris]
MPMVILSSSLSAGSSYQHQTRRTSCSAKSSCWANARSVPAAADAKDGLRSQRPTQLAQCPPKAHDVMLAAVGEAAAAMVAAVAAAQQEVARQIVGDRGKRAAYQRIATRTMAAAVAEATETSTGVDSGNSGSSGGSGGRSSGNVDTSQQCRQSSRNVQ